MQPEAIAPRLITADDSGRGRQAEPRLRPGDLGGEGVHRAGGDLADARAEAHSQGEPSFHTR